MNRAGPVVTVDGRRLFGLDAEHYRKVQAKRDSDWENACLRWLRNVFPGDIDDDQDLWVTLKNGVLLCRLVNLIKPGTIPRINTTRMVALTEMDNILMYIKACWILGIPESAFFTVQDLHQQRDMNAVVQNLVAVATLAPSLGWEGPILDASTQSAPKMVSLTDELESDNLSCLPRDEQVLELGHQVEDVMCECRQIRGEVHTLQAAVKSLKRQQAEECESLKYERSRLLKEVEPLRVRTPEKDTVSRSSTSSVDVQQLEVHFESELAAMRRTVAEERRKRMRAEQEMDSLQVDFDAVYEVMEGVAVHRQLRMSRRFAVRRETRRRPTLAGNSQLLKAGGRNLAADVKTLMQCIDLMERGVLNTKSKDVVNGARRLLELVETIARTGVDNGRMIAQMRAFVNESKAALRSGLGSPSMFDAYRQKLLYQMETIYIGRPPRVSLTESAVREHKMLQVAVGRARHVSMQEITLGVSLKERKRAKTRLHVDMSSPQAAGLDNLQRAVCALMSNLSLNKMVFKQLLPLFRQEVARRTFCYLLKELLRQAKGRALQLKEQPFNGMLFLMNACLLNLDLQSKSGFITATILTRVCSKIWKRDVEGEKLFLQSFLCQHSMWRTAEFWSQMYWHQLLKQFRRAFKTSSDLAGSNGVNLAAAVPSLQTGDMNREEAGFVGVFTLGFVEDMMRWQQPLSLRLLFLDDVFSQFHGDQMRGVRNEIRKHVCVNEARRLKDTDPTTPRETPTMIPIGRDRGGTIIGANRNAGKGRSSPSKVNAEKQARNAERKAALLQEARRLRAAAGLATRGRTMTAGKVNATLPPDCGPVDVSDPPLQFPAIMLNKAIHGEDAVEDYIAIEVPERKTFGEDDIDDATAISLLETFMDGSFSISTGIEIRGSQRIDGGFFSFEDGVASMSTANGVVVGDDSLSDESDDRIPEAQRRERAETAALEIDGFLQELLEPETGDDRFVDLDDFANSYSDQASDPVIQVTRTPRKDRTRGRSGNRGRSPRHAFTPRGEASTALLAPEGTSGTTGRKKSRKKTRKKSNRTNDFTIGAPDGFRRVGGYTPEDTGTGTETAQPVNGRLNGRTTGTAGAAVPTPAAGRPDSDDSDDEPPVLGNAQVPSKWTDLSRRMRAEVGGRDPVLVGGGRGGTSLNLESDAVESQ